MKTLLVFLAFVIGVLAQNPAANIAINQTNITGGIVGDCLTVSSTKKLSQQVCTAGGVTLSGDVAGPSGSNTVVKLQGRAMNNTGPSTGQFLGWNGSAWTPLSGGSLLAPGSDTYCIFNDGGVFGADAGCTYNKATDNMNLTSVTLGDGIKGASGNDGFQLYPEPTFPSGLASIYNNAAPNCTGGTKCQTYFEMDSLVDTTAKYGNPIFRFSLLNPSATPNYSDGFEFGLEGDYLNNGMQTVTRLYAYDFKNLTTIWYYTAEFEQIEFSHQTYVHDNFIVSGTSIQPIIYGGTGTGSSLLLYSTNNASAATDRIDMIVGTSGAPVTALSLSHAGVMTLSASTFVLGGHTCSIVATVLTCP